MKKRTALIAALVSLMPMGQKVLIGTGAALTGAALTSAAVMLAAPLKVNAESALFYYNRGNQKNRDGDHYGAISDYSKAIEVNPYHPKVYWFYSNRGFSKGALKDLYGAITDYTKSIAIKPNAFAYLNRGIDKNAIGDKKGACADLREAKSFGEKNASKALQMIGC
tara:strand:- start:67 stop:564 length:498 start_codon:yes stop_codon:yes gene_type:complete